MATKKTAISPHMRKWSEHLANALRKPLKKELVERVKLHTVDTFAAMISGTRLLPGKRAIPYVKAIGGKPEAGVVGTRLVVSAANAALANGMFGHADETDDTHPPTLTHPGTSVVPAALAIGERDGLAGASIIRAIALGYDVCARMLLTLHPVAYLRSGHHAGATGQLFGAAAAAGALLRLDADEMRYLMAYTGEHTSGLYAMFRDPEHIEKAYAMGGMPAHNGVAGALMVAHGWTGVEDVFSGQRDFFDTFAPEAIDRNDLVEGLGVRHEMMRASIKRWPTGGPIQGPMQVLHELIEQHGIEAAQVAKVVMRLSDTELDIVNGRDMPDICLQHLIALMLVDGKVSFKTTHDYERMRDPKVLAIRKLVEVVGEESMRDPQRRWNAAIEIRLKDGRTFTNETKAAKGSFENPIERKELEVKAIDLIAPILGKQKAAALLSALWSLDKLDNVRKLRRLYRK